MSKTLKATLIWKINQSEYKGNAHFFGEICQHLDAANFQINEIVAKGMFPGPQVKVSAEVEISYPDTQEILDEDEAVNYIIDQLSRATWYATYLVLVDADESEFNNLQPA